MQLIQMHVCLSRRCAELVFLFSGVRSSESDGVPGYQESYIYRVDACNSFIYLSLWR